MSRLPYPRDLTGTPREIVHGILYVLCNGCTGRVLPRGRIWYYFR